ncbi:hypothetical protein M9Y10_014911 [Tritrichomonas musculus]|uniref:SAC domain-containing protein n=1 Tax=Tritrichomonas musculus TaxID=1915356 RepID=A0ABR2L0U2_9EUKA
MYQSGVYLYEVENSEISYLVVHIEKTPSIENDKYFFNSGIKFGNSIFSMKDFSNDETTYVFTIDMTTGGICFYGLPNVDLFPSPKKAYEKLSSIHKLKSAIPIFLGTHLIGATVDDKSLYILTIKEKEEVSVIFNQPIYKIKKTNVHVISWDQKGCHRTFPFDDQNSIENKKPDFLDFEVNENHFFSPTLDICSPFPYPRDRINSNNFFCWNKRFIKIFEDVGAIQSCVVILQGTVFSMNDCRTCFSDNIVFVLKRSSSNSGTRYLARGMNNDDQEPANECECELIFVKDQNHYFAHTWRRGSPPIFWGTDATLFTAKNIVNKEANESSSYGKTHFYFLQDIFVRFDVKKCHVISLLKNDGSEKEINDAYEDSINKLNQSFGHIMTNDNDSFNIVFTRFNFDEIDSDNVIQYFINQMIDEIQSVHFTEINEDDEIIDHQNIVYRFNCADSLDRTNATTFALGVILTAKYANDYGRSLRRNSSSSWNEPFSFLQPSVINFLCKTFTRSGDIASKMYANTSANRSYLIKNFFIPDKNDEDIEINNDVVNIVWRQINSIMFDRKRQQNIFDWLNSDSFRRKRFVLDQQHIGFYQFLSNESNKTENDNNNNLNSHFIDEIILSCDEKTFTLSTKSLAANEVCVIFPEPVVVCSVSFLVVPQKKIQDVPSFDLYISDQLADRDTFATGSNATFMHRITFPTFIDKNRNFEKRWVTYDLISIAKKSSQFPLDPETLRFTRFAKIRFNLNSNQKENEIFVSNVKFAVKIPSNPKSFLFIKGHPPSVDLINTVYDDGIDINSSSYIRNILEIERDRIERGISDYHRNNILISKRINPWIYDFPSQILIQKSENKCLICGSKFTDKFPPFYYISHKFMPQFVMEFNDFVKKYNVSIPSDCDFSPTAENTQKIIEMMGLHYIKVCNACREKLIVYWDDQERILTETVFIKVDPTKEKVTRNFKTYPHVTNKSVNDDFSFTFNSNHCKIFNAPNGIISDISKVNDCLSNDSDLRIKSKKVVVGFSFISFVRLNEIKVSLNSSDSLQLKVSILIKIKNQNSSDSYEIIEKNPEENQASHIYSFNDFPNSLIKFFDLVIEDYSTHREKDLKKKHEIEVSIKRIEINGMFDIPFIDRDDEEGQNLNSNSDQEISVVPNFNDGTNLLLMNRIQGWDEQTRTQLIVLDDEKHFNAIVFKPSEIKNDKKLPSSLIVAYYDCDDIVCYFESLIIPDWLGKYKTGDGSSSILDIASLSTDDDNCKSQFVFPIKELADIRYILIFYLDREEKIIPYKIMPVEI